MNFAIRVDASLDIGTGHVMRCLALAEHLTNLKHQVIFFTRSQPGSLEEIITSKGFPYILMECPGRLKKPEHSSDYQAWLQVSETEDAKDVTQKLSTLKNSIDWLIVDHYGINKVWEKQVKKQTPSLNIFAIDDLGRTHAADLLLDTTLNRSAAIYQSSDIEKTCLTGSEYALLRPEFNLEREKALPLQKTQKGLRLLISMGGGDQLNITENAVNALLNSQPKTFDIGSVEIVLSPRNKNFKAVKTLAMKHGILTLHEFVEDMAALMSRCDIAIGAPGTTSWERACLGLPAVLIPIADNQQDNAEALYKAGAIQLIQNSEIDTHLILAIEEIANNLSRYQNNNLNIADGLGINKVYQYISPLNCKDGSPVTLRNANNMDIETVYQWQILEDTRRFARNPGTPSWPEHKQWMQNKLQSFECYFYIIQYNGNDIGVVRLDHQSTSRYEVSILIDPSYFGLGIASIALKLLLSLHKSIDILATVLTENATSHKLFQSANFNRIDENTYIFSKE